MKPLIGITSNYFNSLMPKLEHGGERELAEMEKLNQSYVGKGMYALNDLPVNLSFQTDVAAIEAAGAIPVVLPLLRNKETMIEALGRLDGLLFAGGSDVGTQWYGEEMRENSGLFGKLEGLKNEDAAGFATEIRERDEMEIELIRYAVEYTRLPILGICRGAQIMNVALGGSLYQDNQAKTDFNHSQFEKWDDYAHPVQIVEHTMMHQIFNRGTLEVNSLHHQSIKELGRDLVISAMSPDGIVESIEYKNDSRFMLGIQWHPEILRIKVPEQEKIFHAFIDACIK